MTTLATRLAASYCLPSIRSRTNLLVNKVHNATGALLESKGKQTSTISRDAFGLLRGSSRGLISVGARKRAIDAREQSEDNGARSVIAYNLSDELKIEKIHMLLDFSEALDQYEINKSLPEDIQGEAVLLSWRSGVAKEENNDSGEQSLMITLPRDIFLFRDGSIVFWGVPYDHQKRLLYSLSPLKINPNTRDHIKEEKEHMTFQLSDELEKSRLTRDTIQISTRNRDENCTKLDQFAFSHAVALSVKLGIWEMTLDEYIESVEWITENMKDGKDIKLTRDQVFKKTGEILCLKHSINLSSDLLDLPDVYWDRSDQETMFSSLFAHLNIRKRTNVMNEKLNNCCELMTLLASHMNDRHHIRLEWMIIVLITVEVLFEVARFL